MLRNGFIIQSQESIYKMIYVLEDDNSIREFVVYTLCHMDLEAKGFERPSEFWAGMEETLPSLILLDIMLPEEDGLSVLKKLREHADTKEVPVIMLTAKDSEYDKVLEAVWHYGVSCENQSFASPDRKPCRYDR